MAKVPVETDKATYIGIEIEFFCRANAVTFLRTHELRTYADIGTDGSIRPNDYVNERGHELRVLCKYSQMKKVMPILKSYLDGVGAMTNDSCGLHVHLDMRGKNAAKAFSNLIAKQEQMYKSVPENRRNNDFCEQLSASTAKKIAESLSLNRKPVSISDVRKEVDALLNKFNVKEAFDNCFNFDTDELIHTIMDHRENNRSIASHYDGISAEPLISGKYKTLEIRIHEGTTNVDEINSWVRYLYDVAFKGVLSLESSSYIKRRIKKYG